MKAIKAEDLPQEIIDKTDKVILIAEPGLNEEGCIALSFNENDLHGNDGTKTRLLNFHEAEGIAIRILQMVDGVEDYTQEMIEAEIGQSEWKAKYEGGQ